MEQWWYAVKGERAGPVEIEALRTLFRQGTIDPTTLAWHSGMPEWTPITDIAALADFAELAHPHAAPPLPPALPAQHQPDFAPADAMATAGPWPRLLARSIDMMLIGIALNIISRIAGGHSPMLYLSGFVTGLLLTPAMLLVEAVFFSTTGWTPGKKLLGVSVRTLDGGPPGFVEYGRRLAMLWLYGLGATLPIINLIAMFVQYRHLRAGATLVWDKDRFHVAGSTLGTMQWVLTAVALAVLTVVYFVLALAN